jgi:hypothetical protein
VRVIRPLQRLRYQAQRRVAYSHISPLFKHCSGRTRRLQRFFRDDALSCLIAAVVIRSAGRRTARNVLI